MARLCELLEVEDLAEISFNRDNDQRMFFIAANFRREVTATVRWLLSRGIEAKCFKVTPYELDHELIIDIQQIIPTPEAADFMISMSNRDGEDKAAQDTQKHRFKLRLAFWKQALSKLRSVGITLYQNVSPTKDHWLGAGSGVSSCPYQMIFGRDEARVELSLA